MSPELAVEMKFPEGMSDQLIEQLMKDPRFQPYRVGSKAPYSVAVEFGSHGYKGGRPSASYAKQGKVSPVEEDIRKWVDRKLHKSGREGIALAHKIYKGIMANGTAPQPFLRPAVHNVLHRLTLSDDAWEGKEPNMAVVAEMVYEEMKRILNEGISYTGETARQLYFEPLTRGSSASSLDLIPEEAWNSDTSDARGDETAWNKLKEKGYRREHRD